MLVAPSRMRSSRKLAARYWDGSSRTRKSASRSTSSRCTYRLALAASSAAETLEVMAESSQIARLISRVFSSAAASGPPPHPLAEQPFLAGRRRQAGMAGARVKAPRLVHVPEPEGVAPPALEAPTQIGK